MPQEVILEERTFDKNFSNMVLYIHNEKEFERGRRSFEFFWEVNSEA